MYFLKLEQDCKHHILYLKRQCLSQQNIVQLMSLNGYVPNYRKKLKNHILIKNTIPEVSRKANELRLTQLPGIHYDKKNATKEAKKISSD